MKSAPYLTVTALGLFALTTGAKADPIPAEPPGNPYVETDGDGVPLAVSKPQSVKISPEQMDQIRKEQAKAEADKDWLIRGYEQQLKARAAAKAADHVTDDQSSNLYYQLSKNKDLAKLAGLTPIDSDGADTSPAYRTGQPPSQPDPSSLRADPSSTASTTPHSNTTSPLSHAAGLKPLIMPLSAPEAAGLHNFYSSLPVAMPSLIGGDPSKTAASNTPSANTASAPTRKPESQDSTDIETPGMIAAEKNPFSNIDSRDLTLDVLPGQTIEQAKANRLNNNTLELPLPMTVDQLHKTLPRALPVDSTAPAAQATPAAPAKPIQTNEADEPLPVSKEPLIVPVHSPIANPFDILNR
jgi:hypothetical protein